MRYGYRRGIVHIVILTACLFVTAVAGASEVSSVATEEKLKVEKAAVCWDVVNHECIDEGIHFSSTVETLYCFTKIAGSTETVWITHVWYYGDAERAHVPLAIKSKSWRTYSSKIIQSHETGKWHVDVLSPAGQLLKKINFEIIE